MKIPNQELLLMNLREAVVSKAEDLYLAVGGPRASALVERLTGVSGVDGLPSDWFCEQAELSKIAVADLAITGHVTDLHDLLEARSFSGKPGDGRFDCDAIEQEHLDFVEAFLLALPTVALGGVDWTISTRRGALYDLVMLGKAWHHLVTAVDTGMAGDFTFETVTPTDLALIAGIEVRTLRNLVGPTKPIRTTERYVGAKKDRLASRAFATVNRTDALDWLVHRKDFRLPVLRPGTLSGRLAGHTDDAMLGRAAVLGGLVLGRTIQQLGLAIDVDAESVRALGDGLGPSALAQRLREYVVHLEAARASNTVPA